MSDYWHRLARPEYRSPEEDRPDANEQEAERQACTCRATRDTYGGALLIPCPLHTPPDPPERD